MQILSRLLFQIFITMSQVPFQLLELNVISAQDLSPVSRNMRTYAVAWINPERKLRTRIDQQGQINPTWNDKFVFRVEDKFLDSDTSSVMIEIYALGWLRDIQVGAVRVLISNLIPPSIREQNNSNRRFVALQIRRPSGRPQGILNMGVTLLDNTMRSMPLYTELSISAVGYRDLMDGKAYKNNLHSNDKGEKGEKSAVKSEKKEKDKVEENVDEKEDKPIETIKLWRSRSDRTDLNSSSIQKNAIRRPGGSVFNDSVQNSLVNGGSLINGGSMVNGSEIGMPVKGGSVISDLGPSPSIVAAAVARGLYPTQLPVPHQAGSSILGDWTVEESSVEGLKSKIDRWRMEVPRMYDRQNFQKVTPRSSKRTTPKNTPRRRRSGSGGSGGPGLFSCFGNAYGCEFTIVCGGKVKKEAEAKNRALNVLSNNDVRYRKYTIEEIEAATDYFSDSLKIGEGGYGPVYKGKLDHTRVAIKVLRSGDAEGKRQFQQEVEVLCCMRHPNMVLLLGACPQYGCLVYEYMNNGSLEDRLFRKDNTPPMSWRIRFKIAAELATGLSFLHSAKPEPLVHRDLKPANILLDRNYACKISDVGLSRLVPASVVDNVTHYYMTSPTGTFCYIDPEYQQTGKLGVKSDIYSFGVILLQILTARPPMGLIHQVQRFIAEGEFADLLDPTVPCWPVEEALTLAKIALQCVELKKKDRPDLCSVVLPELNRLKVFGKNNRSSQNSPKSSHVKIQQVPGSLDD